MKPEGKCYVTEPKRAPRTKVMHIAYLYIFLDIFYLTRIVTGTPEYLVSVLYIYAVNRHTKYT